VSRANEPAYPVPYDTAENSSTGWHGLSVRERFAMAALQGLLADNGDNTALEYVKRQLGILEHETYIPSRDWPRYVAMKAVAHADALLAELAKERT
jgi:hypothetical protein